MKRLYFLILMFLSVACDRTPDPAVIAPEVVSPPEVVSFEAHDSEVAADPTPEEKEVVKVVEKEERAKPVVKKKPVKKAPPKKEAPMYKPAVLKIITNFDKADATVNGLSYPEYQGENSDGMVLPAGGPYTVIVKHGAKAKTYSLHLKPYETRLLFVELSGYQEGKPVASSSKPAKKEVKKEEKKKTDKKEDDKKGPGKVTVYSKPAGTIMADGKSLGDKTPGTIELENGRHEIQVEYEGGATSEKKIVRVRDGSRIKLFFRERKK